MSGECYGCGDGPLEFTCTCARCEIDRAAQKKVNHPKHYQGNKFEVIDIIEDFKLDFLLGNSIKYILRAGKKEDLAQDLKKAIWYLERKCQKLSND